MRRSILSTRASLPSSRARRADLETSPVISPWRTGVGLTVRRRPRIANDGESRPGTDRLSIRGRWRVTGRGEIANSRPFVYLRQHRRRRDGSSEPAEHGRHTTEQGGGSHVSPWCTGLCGGRLDPAAASGCQPDPRLRGRRRRRADPGRRGARDGSRAAAADQTVQQRRSRSRRRRRHDGGGPGRGARALQEPPGRPRLGGCHACGAAAGGGHPRRGWRLARAD